MKPFKNLDEQLDILTDRGLIITNRERTRKYLLSNNYYNIINGYSKFFQQNGTDDYIEGVTFDEVASLYTFDKDIKRAVLQSILEAEHHIKSIVAHRFAEAYEDKKYAYLDTQSYDNNKILEVGDIISKFSKIIKNKKNKCETSIYHYFHNHGDVPIWVLTDYLEFGITRRFISNLPTRVQNNIAKDMVTLYGMSDLGPIKYNAGNENVFLGRDYNQPNNVSGEVAYEIDQEVRKIINTCHTKARQIIEAHKTELETISHALMEYETLTAEQIQRVVKGEDISADFKYEEKESSEPVTEETVSE